VPVAFVVPARHVDEAALAASADRVAPYKRPRRIATVDRLPRTPAGKLLRRELR
jgi:acyl-coenzyme A synthetase/AMP-(fatty) acid ligase